MLKLLFNIFIIYAIWQILKMFFAVKKTQNHFQRNMEDLNSRMKNQHTQHNPGKKKPLDNEGEYVDYEEVK
ncbi:MAG: hypothetical protein V4613_03100 [Bacteroidota bacterium]